MARTKKIIKQAKNAVVPAEIVEQAQPVPPPKPPPPPSEFWKRVLARREAIKEKRERTLREWKNETPPMIASELRAETVVEGKTVEYWAKLLVEREEIIEVARKKEGTRSIIVDNNDLPGWSLWAVREWERAGRPSRASKALEELETLRERAENAQGNANRDKAKLEAADNEKEKKRLTKEVEKYTEKAKALFDEVAQKREAIREEFGI